MTKTKKSWNVRRIHLWVGICLAIPMALMAVSGILIAMRSVSTVQVPMSWLGSGAVLNQLPIITYLETADGAAWIGNVQGLNKVVDDVVESIPKFAGEEVVGLAAIPGNAFPIVATKMRIWSESNGVWKSVAMGRVRQLSSLPDGRVFAVVGGRGEMADGKPLITQDGQQWESYAIAVNSNKRLPALTNPTIPLHQFMREIHSGAYFFGKGPGEMVWSNIIGWVLAALSMTGLWMWLKIQQHKSKKRAMARGIQTNLVSNIDCKG